MIVTEEEAKTKRCQESFGDSIVSPYGLTMPMYGAAGSYGQPSSAGVYQTQTTSPSMCIASACMAWRWVEGEFDQGGQRLPVGGYCGKAGPP